MRSRVEGWSAAADRKRNRPKPRAVRLFAAAALFALSAVHVPGAQAQYTAAEEAARRRTVLARLPENAAKRLFGLAATASPGPAQAIGGYAKGCLGGGVELPPDGPNWQVMRPSRNRAWGHPALLASLERLATAAVAVGWPGLLVGDMAQPRGGPMLTGHTSHQIGLDADIWLTPMPERRLTREQRDEMPATNVVAAGGNDIDPGAWQPAHLRLLETAARLPGVVRIFVNPAIKRALCRDAGPDRGWLSRIRPWWGHDYHFHIRIACPPGQPTCHGQPPVPSGDGCGSELAWWFTPEGRHPKPGPPSRPLLISDLPSACAALVLPAGR
jgi:penicillin-insensitive murein endopeptidase